MPPRRATHRQPAVIAEPQVPQENRKPPNETPIAQALSRIAEAMQHMSQSNRREEHRLEIEGDRALERFLRFHPPQYYGRHSSEQEAETWIEEIEDIFTALHYGDQRKVQFASFRLQGPA
jgi:hypothetical protein